MARPPPPFDRSIALACSLRTFRDRSIEITCCSIKEVPLKLLGAEGGRGSMTMADLMARLRCERCGKPPICVYLEEDQTKGLWAGGGQAPGWHILLMGEPTPEMEEMERDPVAYDMKRRRALGIL